MKKGCSTLMSFGFGSYMGVDDIPESVLRLFKDMSDNPEKSIECVEEVLNAALEGRINLNADFNLCGYDYAVRANNNLTKEKSRQKQVFLDTSVNEGDKESAMRNGGMSVDYATASAVNELVDAYEEILDDAELQFAVETIKSLNKEFIVEYNVNLVSTIQKAIQGIPQAISKLKELCDECDIVSEQVYIILSSGKDIEHIFA